MKTHLSTAATTALLLALPLAAQADPFPNADHARQMGQRLVGPLHAQADPFPNADHAAGKDMHARLCVECHERKYGGEDGSAIYLRPDRRVTTPSALSQQVTTCTTMLNLDLFPEDEHHLAGYLNKHYYKFE